MGNTICKTVCKYIILLTVGGFVYYAIELMWRGYSHISMFFVGGLCLVLMGLINEILSWETPLPLQMLIAAVIVTTVEFAAGCVLNLWLGLNIWDYSDMPLNVLGQICLLYFGFWYGLSLVGIVLDDWLRYWLFGEEKPGYTLI